MMIDLIETGQIDANHSDVDGNIFHIMTNFEYNNFNKSIFKKNVARLIELGTDINFINSDGKTPYMKAMLSGKTSIAEIYKEYLNKNSLSCIPYQNIHIMSVIRDKFKHVYDIVSNYFSGITIFSPAVISIGLIVCYVCWCLKYYGLKIEIWYTIPPNYGRGISLLEWRNATWLRNR